MRQASFSTRVKQEIISTVLPTTFGESFAESVDSSEATEAKEATESKESTDSTESIGLTESSGSELAILRARQDEALFDPEFVLYFMLLAQAEFRVPRIRFTASLKSLANLYQELFHEIFDHTVDVKVRGRRHTLTVDDLQVYREVTATLKRLFNFDPVRGSFIVQRDQMELSAQRSALQGLFLSSASMANPELSYQMEFQFRRPAAAQVAKVLFSTFDLEPLLVRRQIYSLLYFKSRDEISQVLRLLGAGMGVLDFENVQAEKEMRGDINRIVNCDQANTQRVVDASMRQIEAIQSLDARGMLDELSPELQEAAQLRLNHPEFSLRDMAEAAHPPVGRSGMNHRLRRLIKLAEDLEALEADEG